MKSIGILVFVLLSIAGQAQCEDAQISIAQYPILSFEGHTKGLYKGDSVFFFEPKTWKACFLRNVPVSSKVDGKWVLLKEGNPDSLLLVANYTKGVLNGSILCFRSNGTLLEKWHFNSSELEGKQFTYYYETGELFDDLNFKNGLRNGKQIRHWYTGSKRETNYSLGLKHGKQLSWHSNGNLECEENYLNGVKNGAFYRWDDNGALSSYIFYIDDTPSGLSVKAENGVLQELYYLEGRSKFIINEYFSSSGVNSKKPDRTSTDIISVKLKKVIEVNDSLITEIDFSPHGQVLSLKQKVLIREEECKQVFYKTGIHALWNEKGDIILIQTYKDDKLINELKLR